VRSSGLLCLLIAAVAHGQQVQYDTLPRPIIEKRLSSFGTANLEREQTLRDLFTESGCSGAKLAEQIVKAKKPPNVICSLPGVELDSTIIVGAHFDFVKAGQGVVDNWSGASLLPSLFQSLNAIPRRHNFLFVGFTDEELGLLGSSYFVRGLTKFDLRSIAAMVNMDSLGTGPTRFETDRSDKRLTDSLAAVAATVKIPIGIVNAHQVGRSDSDSFQDKKVPSINIHSLTKETFPILHSSRDRMDAIHMDDYYASYRLIAAYLAFLDLTLTVE
jgi:putative aminopeptidase FrvX